MTRLTYPRRLVRGARRNLALVALLPVLSATVALHHGGMLDMDMHDAPMLMLCLGLAATATLGARAAPPLRPTRWLPVDQDAPLLGTPAVLVPSPSRDGPAFLQVFLN